MIEQLLNKERSGEETSKLPPPMSEQEQMEALAFLKDCRHNGYIGIRNNLPLVEKRCL